MARLSETKVNMKAIQILQLEHFTGLLALLLQVAAPQVLVRLEEIPVVLLPGLVAGQNITAPPRLELQEQGRWSMVKLLPAQQPGNRDVT
jgi:hypothetical protein